MPAFSSASPASSWPAPLVSWPRPLCSWPPAARELGDPARELGVAVAQLLDSAASAPTPPWSWLIPLSSVGVWEEIPRTSAFAVPALFAAAADRAEAPLASPLALSSAATA